jgi:hypothetical protein
MLLRGAYAVCFRGAWVCEDLTVDGVEFSEGAEVCKIAGALDDMVHASACRLNQAAHTVSVRRVYAKLEGDGEPFAIDGSLARNEHKGAYLERWRLHVDARRGRLGP